MNAMPLKMKVHCIQVCNIQDCLYGAAGNGMVKVLNALAAAYRGDHSSRWLPQPCVHTGLWPDQMAKLDSIPSDSDSHALAPDDSTALTAVQVHVSEVIILAPTACTTHAVMTSYDQSLSQDMRIHVLHDVHPSELHKADHTHVGLEVHVMLHWCSLIIKNSTSPAFSNTGPF